MLKVSLIIAANFLFTFVGSFSKAAIEAAELDEMLKKSIEIRRQELQDSLQAIEEVICVVCMF